MSSAVRKIVCVGSSFAAGPGIEPVKNASAGRSSRNYAHIAAGAMGNVVLTDLSVSGATLRNIVDEPQAPLQGRKASGPPAVRDSDGMFRPQLMDVPADADLVLLTAGGNDVGYVSHAILDCLQASSWLGWLLGWILFLLQPKPPCSTADEVASRLANAVDTIHERAPNAQIVLVEYLALFPDINDVDGAKWTEKCCQNTGLRPEQVIKHCRVARMLSDVYASIADDPFRSSWCTRISVDAASRNGHALGSDDPWCDGFSMQEILKRSHRIPLHPNARGMEEVGQMVLKHLREMTK